MGAIALHSARLGDYARGWGGTNAAPPSELCTTVIGGSARRERNALRAATGALGDVGA